VAFLQSMKSLT